MRRAASCLAVAWLAAGMTPALAAPAAGTYAARLCVTLADQPASCGPAQAHLAGNRLRVRVSDIEYRLELQPRRTAGDLIALLMHGAMQIDEFNAPYAWRGAVLQFDDADKRTRYEVQLGERQRPSK
jgi:hypothetical protein